MASVKMKEMLLSLAFMVAVSRLMCSDMVPEALTTLIAKAALAQEQLSAVR